jgi:hypothetical protein
LTIQSEKSQTDNPSGLVGYSDSLKKEQQKKPLHYCQRFYKPDTKNMPVGSLMQKTQHS